MAMVYEAQSCQITFTQYARAVHVHGESGKVEKGLVCAHLLTNHVVAVYVHDGYANEQMEIIRLPMTPTAFPNG